MKSFIVTLNGYGQLLKENFRGKRLFDYAGKANFAGITEKGRWGYIRLGQTLEKAYFSLFQKEGDFPGEAFIRSLNYNVFTGEVKTFFLAGFMTHAEGLVVETEPAFSDKELCGLLDFASGERSRFEFAVDKGEAVAGFKKDLPLAGLPFPCSMGGRDFSEYLCRGKEFTLISDMIEKTSSTLAEHPINRVRADLSEPVGNLLWLWGMGKSKEVPSFGERIGRETFYLGVSGNLRGLPELCGFKVIGDVSGGGEDSLLWVNNSLDFNESRSIWLKRFEAFDRDILGAIRQRCAGEEYRIIFIFDAFTGKNAFLNNEWGVYCAVTEEAPPFRLKKRIRQGRGFIEEFSK